MTEVETAGGANADGRRRRVAVLDLGFIPIYWARFWEILNRTGTYDYVVYHGEPSPGSGWVAAPGPHDFPNRKIKNRELNVLGWRPIWQPVVREVTTGKYDAVILGHEIKFLSNLVIAAVCKLKGVKVIYWGFGYHADAGLNFGSSSPPLLKRLAAGFKDKLARFADGYLAYTERGRQRMSEVVGLDPSRIWVVRQTVDVEGQIALHARFAEADRRALRAELGLDPDAVVLLFIGRLVDYKRVDQLIDALRRLETGGLCKTRVEGIVIGGGQQEAALKAQAEGLLNVRFEGPISDQAEVARYLRAVDAIVVPGLLGITVTHAFAHGVPLLTRASGLHSPEADYIEDGVNGLMVEGDQEAFVQALARFADDPALRARLAAGALRARESLSLAHMASQFDACARTVLGDEAPSSGGAAAERLAAERASS